MLHQKKISCDSSEFVELSAAIFHTGNSIRFTAHGASMFPLIQDGDILWVSPIEPAHIRRGDVLLFVSSDGRPMIHRVRKQNIVAGARSWLMQGDHKVQADDWIAEANVLGVVSQAERDGQPFSLRSPWMKWLGFMASFYDMSNPISHALFKAGYHIYRQFAFFRHP